MGGGAGSHGYRLDDKVTCIPDRGGNFGGFIAMELNRIHLEVPGEVQDIADRLIEGYQNMKDSRVIWANHSDALGDGFGQCAAFARWGHNIPEQMRTAVRGQQGILGASQPANFCQQPHHANPQLLIGLGNLRAHILKGHINHLFVCENNK
jgi:hypothetical protein